MQGRTKSTNNRSTLKDRIKTIEYHDANFNSIVNRSSTVQKRKRMQAQNKFDTSDSSVKPYSNFAPSTNTRSNITIDRSGSLGYGKIGLKNQNPSTIPTITSKSNISKKQIGPINEYEDDSKITINPNSFGKRLNLNTIGGVKNADCSLTINSNKHKSSAKELIKKPRFAKAVIKDGAKSKSNQRVIKDNYEKTYMQSPSKLLKNPNTQARLKKNIQTYESDPSLKEKYTNLRNKSVSPGMPRVREMIAREPRHKTTVKERPPENFNNSMKHDTSSIITSKDKTGMNLTAFKHAVREFSVYSIVSK
jgi:hypothetical protein